jgi:hypothetical protein
MVFRVGVRHRGGSNVAGDRVTCHFAQVARGRGRGR